MESSSLRQYIAIDLKSFYASVECVERGLDPLDTHLVVADASRTQKTICLAVSPALKAYGTGGRPRLFEVIQRVREANNARRMNAPRGCFTGRSHSRQELAADPALALDYIVARPRMAHYIDFSTRVYKVYLNYFAPEDIHVYSIDEVFIDATSYLKTYGLTTRQLTMKVIRDVLAQTGITATAGIGTNLYLCKVAMDIVAKKMPPDADGVRIATLDEASYRRQLWAHEPLTDFWRVGRGTTSRLAPYGIRTMGDIARCSLSHEGLLYKLFGVNAELLIDHAWGIEPVTMQHIKAYRPATHSLCSGQVLTEPYTAANARVVILEMADNMALDLLRKRLVTNQVALDIGYDSTSLADPAIAVRYQGRVTTDYYGRRVPAHAHGTTRFDTPTSSARLISEAVSRLYDRIVNPALLIRRLNLSVNNLVDENHPSLKPRPQQLDLFADNEAALAAWRRADAALQKERRLGEAMLKIKGEYGKNAILKGLSYTPGATARTRNQQIGGHHE